MTISRNGLNGINSINNSIENIIISCTNSCATNDRIQPEVCEEHKKIIFENNIDYEQGEEDIVQEA
jgi:hypothetical protein